jgi:hypothetical protein
MLAMIAFRCSFLAQGKQWAGQPCKLDWVTKQSKTNTQTGNNTVACLTGSPSKAKQTHKLDWTAKHIRLFSLCSFHDSFFVVFKSFRWFMS